MPVSPKTRAGQQRKSGVYLIRNTVNGKVYIGSAAKSIEKRWRDHKRCLRAGVHPNYHLQSAWTKYGEDAFVFVVLLTCNPSECLQHEQTFIDSYDASDREHGYNLRPTAGSMLGFKWTDNSRAKAAENARGNKSHLGHTHTLEARAKMSAALVGRKPARAGIKHTPESIAKMAAAARGKKQSEETIAKRKVAFIAAIERRRERQEAASKIIGTIPVPKRLR